MDPELLINEVYARPPLWDRSSPAHSNRDIISALWKEVAEACGVSCEVAKSKWKHLRDHFRCELKRCLKSSKNSKSGRYKSSWVWFWPLVFLKEQMLHSKRGGGGGDGEDSGAEDEASALSGGEGDQDEGSGGGALAGAAGARATAAVKAEPSPHRSSCKRRRSDIDFLDFDKRNLLMLEDTAPPTGFDDTQHFLLSLAPALRTLPLARQMFLRLKVQELVTNEVMAFEEAAAAAAAGGAAGVGLGQVETALDIPEINQDWHDAAAGIKCDVADGWQTQTK